MQYGDFSKGEIEFFDDILFAWKDLCAKKFTKQGDSDAEVLLFAEGLYVLRKSVLIRFFQYAVNGEYFNDCTIKHFSDLFDVIEKKERKDS